MAHELTFEDFKERAKDKSLSKYEKIGFPDSYREGYERKIFDDILSKLPLHQTKNKVVIDIGCGCTDLVDYHIDISVKNKHELVLVDSIEMLDNISLNGKKYSTIKKEPGYFPNTDSLFKKYTGKADYIIIYSVLHYFFNHNSMFTTLHKAVELLKPGGMLLLGDIPNISKRKRFIESAEGKAFLKKAGNVSGRGVTDHSDETEKIDDAIVFGILTRFRNFGCETYLLPQAGNLPMANRREDILIIKR